MKGLTRIHKVFIKAKGEVQQEKEYRQPPEILGNIQMQTS